MGIVQRTKDPDVPAVATADEVEVSILSLPDDAARWNLVSRLLEYRKRVFIDTMDWELYHAEGIEADQYDSLDTVYIIAHRSGTVVGGARIKPTSVSIGYGTISYSYMIRDACLGLLPGMPTTLCDDPPPVSDDVWELTRFAADPIPGLGESILNAANEYLHLRAVKECLFLGSPAFLRMARRLGWSPVALGRATGNKDGKFIAFKCPVRPPFCRAPSGLA